MWYRELSPLVNGMCLEAVGVGSVRSFICALCYYSDSKGTSACILEVMFSALKPVRKRIWSLLVMPCVENRRVAKKYTSLFTRTWPALTCITDWPFPRPVSGAGRFNGACWSTLARYGAGRYLKWRHLPRLKLCPLDFFLQSRAADLTTPPPPPYSCFF